MPRPMVTAEAFWTRVDQSGDGCWPWTGGTWLHGYGRTSFMGRPGVLAHRVAFTLAHGPIPVGMDVCHRCDNPACCNPAHLFLGTHADNMRDAAEKGRMARGERARRARLTADQVREIRRRYPAESSRQLGRAFGVSHSSIQYVVARRSWRHVA